MEVRCKISIYRSLAVLFYVVFFVVLALLQLLVLSVGPSARLFQLFTLMVFTVFVWAISSATRVQYRPRRRIQTQSAAAA